MTERMQPTNISEIKPQLQAMGFVVEGAYPSIRSLNVSNRVAENQDVRVTPIIQQDAQTGNPITIFVPSDRDRVRIQQQIGIR